MSTCISRHGEYGSHEPLNEYECARCGLFDEGALTAELDRLRALVATCSCGGSPETYDGPQADCPVHGAVRALAETQAKLAAAEIVVAAAVEWRKLYSTFLSDETAVIGPRARAVLEAVDRYRTATAPTHDYLSTACLHAQHEYCQASQRDDGGTKVPARCKFCAAPCRCACHRESSAS